MIEKELIEQINVYKVYEKDFTERWSATVEKYSDGTVIITSIKVHGIERLRYDIEPYDVEYIDIDEYTKTIAKKVFRMFGKFVP